MSQFEKHPTDTYAHVLAVEVVGRTEDKLETQVAFEYTASSDPLAVAMVFSTATGPIRWTVARALLDEALLDPAGDGDVHAWPSLDHDGLAAVLIELCGDGGGSILLQVRARDLSTFLAVTYDVVERGAESELLDLDSVVDAILASNPVQRG